MNETTPDVSVIIVAYNYANYLPRALNACANQTFRNFEIVIINNGSTDNTQEIIDDFVIEHPELNIIAKEIIKNEGLPKGRNEGLIEATGTYILFNDADDWMEPTCLEEMLKEAKKTDADRLMAKLNYVNNNGICASLPFCEDICKWTIPGLQASIIRRSLFTDNKISFNPRAYYDDFAVTSKINVYVKKEAFVWFPIYNMFLHSDSMTGHGKDWYAGRTAERLDATFADIISVKTMLQSETDKMLFEYSSIQKYYTCVFDCIPYSMHEKLINYKTNHKVMEKYFGDYLRNKNIKFKARNHYEGHFKRNIWMASRCEKIDKLFGNCFCMTILLFAYHCAVKLGLYHTDAQK